MERLISDANEYAQTIGMAGDLSIDSFSDIVTAIDLVQQKQGIAGTTAKEAATTIEGSLNMTKAAWENLVTSFADPDADIGQAMDNLVVAIVGDKEGEGLLNNIIPAVQRAIEGIAQVIQQAAPILAEQFPVVVQNVLPTLIEAAATLIAGIISALPSLISVLVHQMPMIVKTLAKALISAGWQFLSAGKDLISKLSSGISSAFSSLIGKVKELAGRIPEAIKSGLGSLAGIGKDMIEGLWNGIKAKFDSVIDRVKALAAKLPEAVKKVLGISSPSKVFAEVGKWIPEGLALGIESNLGAVYSASDAMADATMFVPETVSIDREGSNNFASSEAIAEMVGDIVGERIADVLDGMNIILDRRSMGKFTRQSVGATV